jgi:Mg2+-importing ATPase
MPWLVGAAAVAAVVLVASHAAQERAFVELLEKARPAWLLWAFALQAATYVAQAEIWRIVLHRAGASVPFPFACRLSLTKLFVDQAIPSMGVSGAVVVARALEQRGVPRPIVMSSVAVDTASFYIAYVIDLAIALALMTAEGHASPLIVTVAALFFAYGSALTAAVWSLSGRASGRSAATLLKVPGVRRIVGMLQQASPRLAHDPILLMRATFLQMVIAALDAATVWVLILSLGATASPAAVFASFMIASVLRSIGLLPGGLGTFEAASVGALTLAGVPVAVGLSATLLFRGLSFWLPMLPGLAFSRTLAGGDVQSGATGGAAESPQGARGFWPHRHPAAAGHGARRAGVPAELVRLAALPDERVLEDLGVKRSGLTSEEADRRRSELGPNEVAQRDRYSVMRALLEKFSTPLNFLLLLLAGTSLLIGDRDAAAIIAVMVVLSVSLAFLQEHRSTRAAEKLQAMVHTTASVRRRANGAAPGNGANPSEDEAPWTELPIHLLVPGDIVHLSAGDMVPADVRLITAKTLYVNQSSLTGESLPAEKSAEPQGPGPTDALQLRNVCFMGTNVVSGTATAVVVLTGSHAYFGGLAASIAGERATTDFDRGVNSVAWLMIRFIAVLAPLVFLINGLTKGNWIEALLFAVAVAVGLTPEMLPMLVTVNLGKGALAMSRKRVIVKRLNSIQNLGAMDVLCTDKTGTLTQDRIIVERHVDLLGNESDDVLLYAYLNSHYQSGLKNLLDVAILQHADAERLQAIARDYRKLDEVPFDFGRRRMSVAVANGSRRLLICKGAVEEVFAVSTLGQTAGETFALDASHLAQLQHTHDQLNEDGFRVIAIACRELPAGQAGCGIEDEAGLTLLGYIAFLDPPKDSAAQAIAELGRHGVTVKILTGDNGVVTRKVCRDVGLAVENVVLGSDLEGKSTGEIGEMAERSTVFAKLSPSQKADVIQALQGRGHVVGFLGDGINDGPALKTADVGISVDSAVDIAKETADIILLEKSLLVLDEGVLEGRKVFGNILKYIRMGASSNFGNMFSVIGASAWLPFLPMAPVQVLANNLLYDFSQSAIPTDHVDEEFLASPRRWEIRNIGRFMLWIGPISSLFDYVTYCVMYFVFGATTPGQAALFQTGWFVESLLSQTLIIHVIRTFRVPFVESRASLPLIATTLAICGIGLWLPFSPLAPLLGLVRLPASYWWILALILGSYLTLTHFVKAWLHRRFGLT